MTFSQRILSGGMVLSTMLATAFVVWAQSSDRENRRAAAAGDQLAERFRQLDKNDDAKLTRDELGPALFELLNSSGDEFVTLEEARQVIREKGIEAVQKAARQSPPAGTTGSTESTRDSKPLTKADARPSEAASTVKDGAAPLRQGPKRLKAGDHGIGRMVPDLMLTDIDGQTRRLSDLQDRRAIVIAFTNTSCPIGKKYAPTLASVEKQYREQKVAFVFVNPTASDKLDEIRTAIKTHGFVGPYVRDADGTIARALGATHTTDVFVLDAKRTLIYRGAVDDQYGFGYSIEEPRIEYLADALAAAVTNDLPRLAATEAPGCPLDLDDARAAASQVAFTYHNRVSRILLNHCVECHRDGGVAPFPLDSYENVVSHGGTIRQAVERGIMPPWFAAPPAKGEVSPFANDCSLADVDKADLLAWLNGGKPAGDPGDAPLPRSFPTGWHIGEPDLIVRLPSPIAVKATGTMPYQNVVVDTGLTEDKYVKAVEIRPTARDVVHHVLAFVLPPAQRGETAAGDDDDNERDGFFGAYAPGYEALPFNDGCGKLLPAGSRLKFQIHYTPNGTATQDQSMLGLIFTDEKPEQLVNVTGISNPRLSIPAGADNFEVTASTPVPRDATVVAFFPHMHLRGKAFRYEAILPDGTSQTLLDIPRYDFNWQLSYRLAEPVKLPAGSIIKATGWYDNSKNNPANPDPTRIVKWGPQTFDEMMIGYIEYYMDGGALGRGWRGGAGGLVLESLFQRLDRDKNGKLSGDELPAAQKEALLKLDTDQDGSVSLEEARRLKQLRGRD